MDEQSPTPEPTIRRALAPPILSAKFGGEKRTFDRQQFLDRKYYAEHISKMIESQPQKWAVKSAADRVQFVKEKRKELLKRRNASSQMRTTGFSFPEQHDEVQEEEWLVGQFGSLVEDVPTETGMGSGRVKGEASDYDTRSSFVDDEEDDEEDMPERPFKEECIKRDLDGDEDTEDEEEDENINVAQKSTIEKEEEEENEGVCRAISIDVDLRHNPSHATSPYWGWNDRLELVLMTPPTCDVNITITASTGSKRKIEVWATDEGGVAKKARR